MPDTPHPHVIDAECGGELQCASFPPGHLGLRWVLLDASNIALVDHLIDHVSEFRVASSALSREHMANIIARSPHSVALCGCDRDSQAQAVAAVELNPVRSLTQGSRGQRDAEDGHHITYGESGHIYARISALVSDSWRGRGIGRSLLEWQVQTATTAFAHASAISPRLVISTVHRDDKESRRLLAAGGFSPHEDAHVEASIRAAYGISDDPSFITYWIEL